MTYDEAIAANAARLLRVVDDAFTPTQRNVLDSVGEMAAKLELCVQALTSLAGNVKQLAEIVESGEATRDGIKLVLSMMEDHIKKARSKL